MRHNVNIFFAIALFFLVGLSMICYRTIQEIVGRGFRRYPVKRAHGKVIVFAKVNGKPSLKVVERAERMCRVKILIVLAVRLYPLCRSFTQSTTSPVPELRRRISLIVSVPARCVDSDEAAVCVISRAEISACRRTSLQAVEVLPVRFVLYRRFGHPVFMRVFQKGLTKPHIPC